MTIRLCSAALLLTLFNAVAKSSLCVLFSPICLLYCALFEFLLAGVASMVLMTVNASWHYGTLLTAANVALLTGAATDCVFLLLRLCGIATTAVPPVVPIAVSFALLALFLWNGYRKATRTAVRTYSVHSAKLKRPYAVAFVSDVHYGHPIGAEKLRRDVAALNALSPDIVILGGDITDDYTAKEQMREAYAILGQIGSKTVFVYGNHDRQGNAHHAHGKQYTEQELTDAIAQAGIEILQDRAIRIGEDLAVFGAGCPDRPRTEKERPAVAATPGTFLLIADHIPYGAERNLAAGADLQLSGHSHAGQLFPNRPIWRCAGYRIYGEYAIGNGRLIVSSGLGLWHVPFRTNGRSEIALVRLEPEA
ncbi:MAG: metallophosphoesterase [Clostridia bacterium]|nr:metallophosphoesterase [Clostridia bacterium]